MSIKILIVEDEILIARELEARLITLGYEVVEIAATGQEAINLTALTQPNIVLMDIVLKGDMDGIEAATEIRQRWGLPIIYLTAYTDEATINRAKITEPLGYIVKPFSVVQIQSSIEMALYKYNVELKLRKVEKWFSASINKISDAIISTTYDDETVSFMNNAAELLTGWRSDKAIGKKAQDIVQIINANTGKNIENSLLSARNEGVVTEIADDVFLVTAKNNQVAINYTCVRMRGEDGVPKGFVIIIRDLTKSRLAKERLLQANLEWIQAMDQLDDAVYLIDIQHRLVRANRSFYQLIKSNAEHAVGVKIADLIHANIDSQHCPVCQAHELNLECSLTLESDSPYNFTDAPTEVELKVTHNQQGDITGMLGSFHDLTHMREVKERLRLSASVFKYTSEGIIITDEHVNIIDVNSAFTTITGYEKSDVIGKNPKFLQSDLHEKSFYREMWQSIEQASCWRGEVWNKHKDGTLVPELLTINKMVDEDGLTTQYIGVFSDITQIKRSQEKLEHLANHDALTGLPNRLLLQERLNHAMKNAKRNNTQLAIFFFDLDHFKLINDSLGHSVGDIVLKKVASYLQDAVREGDTLARIGGDEFVLLVEGVDQVDSITVLASKLLLVFKEPIEIEAREMRMNASLGISIFPQDGSNSDDLLRNADAAMYRAKAQGRNNFQFYTKDLTQKALEHVLMENQLRCAVDQNEFRVLYQPQIDFSDGAIIGMEALVRWHHPDLGIVSPVKFIPLAEDTGLIHPIGEWVLRTACLQGKAWLDKGLDFGRISVNVSGPQIQRGSLPDIVAKVLLETGMPAINLELEVTEGFIMKQAELAIDQLQMLRDMGVSLAIDDFGTGYSSLSYLKLLPIDKLKIDQSFVRDIPEDPNDMAIANAVIVWGQSLGLTVIAEGVETNEQVDFLTKAGCNEAQGFLYSKPIDAEAIEILIRG